MKILIKITYSTISLYLCFENGNQIGITIYRCFAFGIIGNIINKYYNNYYGNKVEILYNDDSNYKKYSYEININGSDCALAEKCSNYIYIYIKNILICGKKLTLVGDQMKHKKIIPNITNIKTYKIIKGQNVIHIQKNHYSFCL